MRASRPGASPPGASDPGRTEECFPTSWSLPAPRGVRKRKDAGWRATIPGTRGCGAHLLADTHCLVAGDALLPAGAHPGSRGVGGGGACARPLARGGGGELVGGWLALRGGAQASSPPLSPGLGGACAFPAIPEPRTVSTFRPLRLFRVRTPAGGRARARPYQRGDPARGRGFGDWGGVWVGHGGLRAGLGRVGIPGLGDGGKLRRGGARLERGGARAGLGAGNLGLRLSS